MRRTLAFCKRVTRYRVGFQRSHFVAILISISRLIDHDKTRMFFVFGYSVPDGKLHRNASTRLQQFARVDSKASPAWKALDGHHW